MNTGGIWQVRYKLSVAWRALPRQLLVVRHIKVVVLDIQEDDLASPVPYKVHSNSTCFSVSTSPHRHLSSSYFHVILSLPLTGKHHPLTISLTLPPPFHLLLFLGHSFICTYSFSLSVSLKPFFHTCLPTSLILLQMCFFQNSPFTFTPNLTILFKLTSLNQIRFTNSKSPNLLHICLHRDHHLDLHPNSIKHALPISDTRFSSNTTLNIHFTIAPYSSILLYQQHIYFQTLQLYTLPYQVLRLHLPFCPPYS